MMLSLAMTLALSASTGGLLSDHLPSGVRLLDSPRPLPGPPPAMPPPVAPGAEEPIPGDYQSMSLAELKVAYAKLGENVPTTTGGTALIIGGVVALVLGGGLVLLMALAVVGGFGLAEAVPWLILGAVVALGGVAMVIIGPILSTNAVRAAKAAERDQAFIKRQMRLLEGGAAPVPTGPGRAPPPPPPPPPLGGLEVRVPMVSLAAF